MKSKLFYKILHITFFTILLCILNIRCAKTVDVIPLDNTNDSTGTIDTIYYGFVLNESAGIRSQIQIAKHTGRCHLD